MSEHKTPDKQVNDKTPRLHIFQSPHRRKATIVVLAVVVFAGISYLAYYEYIQLTTSASTKAMQATTNLNKALLKNNKTQALADAKIALANEPNNVDNILAVAYLLESQNPNEAKQYFKQALDVSNQQDDANLPGKSAGTYWAAANLAELAGETNQAKQYYQEVIKAANPSNSYQQSLVEQSQAQLRKLQ